MKNLLTILFLLIAIPSFATDYHVRKGASGANDGSDWTDAWSEFDQISYVGMTGGDTIYIATGTYTTQLRMDAAGGTSSSSMLTVQRATASSHGSATGWSAAYDDVVTWRSTTANIHIDGYDYIHINGVTSGGFYLDAVLNSTGYYGLVDVRDSTEVIVEYVTVDGLDEEADDTGIRLGYTGGVTAYDITVRNCIMQNMPNDGLKLINVDGVLIEDNYFGPHIASTTSKHSDGIEATITDNVVLRRNYFNWNGDMIQLGILTAVSGRWDIYSNLFVREGTNDGVTAVYKTNSTNPVVGPIYFYNNTIYKAGRSFDSESNTTITASNNVFYDLTGVYSVTNVTNSYNYYPTGEGPSAAGDQEGGDPFTDSTNFDLTLAAYSGPIDNGTVLGSTYNTDYDGNTRSGSWDMGAYEYGSSPGGSIVAGTGSFQSGTGSLQ